MQQARDEISFRDLTLHEFVERLASPAPIPGGGSAAAVAASLGASLVTMVASLSIGRERYQQHSATLQEAASAGRRLSERFLALAQDDADAYGALSAARRLPRDTEQEREARSAAMSAAARHAAEVPLETLHVCLGVVAQAERLAGRSNVNAASDLAVAALLADAAAKAAAANVLINLPSVSDKAWADDATQQVQQLVEAVDRVAQTTREIVGSGESREPIAPTVEN